MFRSLIALAAISRSLATAGGSISGTITDPSGAPVPETAVVARSTERGAVRSTATNETGFYAFPDLPPGSYTLEARHAGFEPQARRGLDLAANAALRVDIALTLGAHGETVTVREAAAGVETASSQAGELIGATKMAGLPLNGRGYTDLLALQPGVVPASSQQPNAVVMAGCTSAPPSGDLNPGSLSVSGQRETANGFRVNGSLAQEDFNMGTAIIPDLESIREVQVLTSNFNAEYGNFAGGQVLVTTKSGTGELHASVFGFLRNTGLDARNYFALERARYDRKQIGGTVGGPVRKDKVFLFADYQGSRMTQGVDTGRISVPSLQDRAGDLSDIASSLTGTVNGQYWANLLSQKLGYGVAPGEPYYTKGCASSEECVLPNARIPQSAWSAPAKALLPYIPEPNQSQNIFSTSSYDETLRDDKGSVRMDAGTRWGSVSAYYFADGYLLNNPYPAGQGGANVPGFNAVSLGLAQLASLGLTTTMGATAVNEVRFGYLRSASNIGKPVGGVGPSLVSQGFADAAGNPGIVALAPKIEGIENVSFNDFTIGEDITSVVQANDTFQWSDDFSKVAGRHALKFGSGLHLDQVNIDPDATYNGAFLFQGSETGSDFADFLLGIASSFTQGDSQSFYLRNRYLGIYAQDSWRARTNLTLNYGLRWDWLPPWREKYNQIQTLVPGEQSVVYPGAPAGLVFPGDPGIPDTLAPAGHANFGPRVGVAYSPNAKTAIRTGYGVFYTAFEGLSAGIMSANPPYGYSYSSLAPPLFATPFVIAASGEDVGQRFPEPIPPLGASARNPDSSVDWAQYLPITGVPAFFHRNVTPYSESYTLAIERQVADDTLVSVRYSGTQAHHLLTLISANPGDPALCLSLSQPEDVMPGTPTCGPFGESATYTTSSGQAVQGTRGPFGPQLAAVTYQKTIANSNYNAIEASFHHAGPSLDLLLGYTYGKSLDPSSSLSEAVNPLNPRLSKALSAFDIRHDFVASYDWKLPLGKLLHGRGGWAGGWSLSGILRFSSGLPVTLYNNNDTSLLGTIPNGINNNGVDTPDHTPGNLAVNTDPRDGKPEFNTALFSLPALGSVGTAARRFFYGPGMANWDAAVHKNLRITEARWIELRVEAFNALNHAQFFGAASVNGNISSASFGQVVSAAAPRLIQIAAKAEF
jgi:hypothetical protein